MSDEKTDTIPTADKSAGLPTQVHIRQLKRRIDDLTELLKSQRQMLQTRGMNLPAGSLDSLNTIKRRLDTLANQVMRTQLELRRLRSLAETTALINSTLDTDSVLNQVMDEVIHLTGAERGYIVMKDRATGELDQFRVARGLDREQLVTADDNGGVASKKSELIVSKTIVNEVASSGEPILTDNASQDSRFQDQKSIMTHGLRSILAVPLTAREEVIGVVYCDNRVVKGLFTDHEKDLLIAFANQAAVAIENARLFESARERLAQISEMRELMTNVFNSILSAVLTTDYNGNILTFNESALVMLGLSESPQGRPLADVLPPLEEHFFTTLNGVLEDGEQRLLEVEFSGADGRTQYWNVIGSALRDARGERQGLALVLDDLTEQRERDAILERVRVYLPPALVDKIRTVDDVNVSGQERLITSIATDVRGFSTFSERLDPGELMEIINKYLSVASDAIGLYEGIVDKYMGDAVTGLFNTQLNPQEDHAIRAVRAALSIVYDLQALHEVLPDKAQHLQFGIGIHTGPVFLGNVGSPDRKEFSALGEATTVSKILEGIAQGQEIIISPATYDLVKDAFECEPRQPAEEKKKGRTDLDTVYRVMRRKKGVTTGQLFLDPELADLLSDLGE